MATDNKCHCGAPARYLLRIVPVGEDGVLATSSVDMWAVCPDATHLTVAILTLISRNNMYETPDKVLMVRKET